MMTAPAADPVALRQTVLAVCVLHDVDLEPGTDGIVLPGDPPLSVSWKELRAELAELDGASPAGRARLAHFLRMRRTLADSTLGELAARARPVGFPVGHPLHPGPCWPRLRLLGGAIEVGVGFVGLLDDPDRVDAAPAGAMLAAGIDPTWWWRRQLEYLDRVAEAALPRVDADPRGTLRPSGDCDVVTLLASPVYRAGLVRGHGGMRSVAVPMRRRGWADLRRIDPAFALAAAAATDEAERGFARPLLVTADEVALVPEGGLPARIELRDPAPRRPGLFPRRC